MAITVNPITGKITFGAVADGTNDSIALDLASAFGVSEDFNDDYSSDNWTDIGTGFGVNVPNGVMDVTGVKGGTNNGSGIDLGAGNVSDTDFVLRFKFEFTSLPTIVTDDSTLYLSIDSIDQSTGANTVGHDALTLQIAKSASSQLTRLVPFFSNGGAVVETAGTSLLADGVGPIYYIEIKRTSISSATWTLFSDSTYTTVIATSTNVISAGITGLRHLVWRSRSDASVGAGEITGEISDVQFWNAKTVPVITSTNWRLRFKYDLTVVNDSGSSVNVGLFVGLGDQDAISGSATAQDGFYLLTSADNGIDTKFRVQTPDNTAPEGTLDDSVFALIPSVDTLFIEMDRDSASQTTVSIYSDATFTTLVETQVQAGVSGSDNLKYLKVFNAENQVSPNTLDGSIDDIVYTDIGAIIIPPVIKEFSVNAILATIDFGNDLTWSFREHDASNLFNIDYDYVVGGSPPSFITRSGVPSSIGTSHLFKVFKKSEIIGSSISVTWSNPSGGSNRIEVADGAYDPSSLIDFPSNSGRLFKGGGILGTSVAYTQTPFVTTVLSAGSINYAGSTEEFLTVFVNISDTQTGTQAEYVVRDVEVSLRGKWQFDDTPVITQVLIGTQQDFGYLNASSVAPPPPTVQFTIDAILATIAFGNDLTWQYREHETNATFPPGMFWTSASALRMFSNPSSVGVAYTLKIFKLSEITGSDIKVTWERTLGNSGNGQIAVYDGVINAESLVDIPPLAGIPNTLLGFFNSTAFFSTKTDTLLASNIDYAGATGTHVTLIIRNNDGSTSDSLALRIFDVDVTLRGKWDFTSGLVITNIRGNQLVNFTDVDDFGYINASSVKVPPVKKEFTINATLIPPSCSPWKHFDDFVASTARLSFSIANDQTIEIPPVAVPTFVKSIKTRIKSTSFQGSVRMFISLFPVSTAGNPGIASAGVDTDSVSMASLSGTLVTHTFTFPQPVVLMPNVRYGLAWRDLINNSPGLDYGVILKSEKDFTNFSPSITSVWREPNSGTPQNYMLRGAQGSTWAIDINILNSEAGVICFFVDAHLIGREGTVAGHTLDWQFREVTQDNNFNTKPTFTFGDEPPAVDINAGLAVGIGYIFKTFKKSDITGDSISVTADVTGTVDIRVYDGLYDRRDNEDFPQGINEPAKTGEGKGIGLLGSIALPFGLNTTVLPSGSINYAGSTEDLITVFVRVRSASGRARVSDITLSPTVSFDLENSVFTTEQTGTQSVMDFGFFYVNDTSEPFMIHEFAVDACLGVFVLRRSIIGDLIIKVLQANPSGLTGLQITDEVRLLRPTTKTSRIKNWIGFLDTRGIIVDDGSNPDWYKTIWTLVP